MKSDALKNYQMLKGSQIAENQMKALKSLLIMLPTAIASLSLMVFIIIAIFSKPMISILIMHQFISLALQVPLSGSVWLILSALMGVLTLTRHKQKIFDKVGGLKV